MDPTRRPSLAKATSPALETALGSLATLRVIYEHRASRWEEEMARISDERERVELLLRQTLGVSLQPNGVHVEF